MIKTAVIIAGGEGSRLMPMTAEKPKTLVEIGGKPILYWIIRWLKRNGIEHLVIGVAYKKEKIFEYMKANNNFGLKVDFSEHTVDGGTAQGFKLAVDRFVKEENFLALNSDEVTNVKLANVVDQHLSKKPLVTMILSPFYPRFATAEIKNGNEVVEFEYGRKISHALVSIGVYIFNLGISKYIPIQGNIEDLVFPKLAKEGRVHAYILGENEEWITINTIKDIKDAELKLKEWGEIS